MAAKGHGNRFERMTLRQRVALLGGAGLALFVILFALAEGAVRVRAWLKHGQSEVRIEDAFLEDEELKLRRLKPGYSSPRLTINSLGFRSPELPKEKPAGTYRIAFLGGSTTYCAEVSGDERTWPHLVVEALKARYPERRFDYLNAGVPGYATIESRRRFDLEVAALEPDLVVIYHGTNDLTQNSRDLAKLQGLSDQFGDRDLSWLSQWSLLAYLVEKNLKVLALQDAVDRETERLDVDSETLASPFARDLRALVEAVQASGAEVALVTFSTRMRPEQSRAALNEAAASALYFMPYLTADSLLENFAAYNETIRKVGDDEGAILIEAALAVPADPDHFTDSVHVTDRGAEALAEAVSAGLVAAID